MDDYGIKARIIKEAEYVEETGATVRQTAKIFGVSKSTVHKDLSSRLFCYDKNLFSKVRKILDKNKAERHIRGGLATRNKYLSKVAAKKQM